MIRYSQPIKYSQPLDPNSATLTDQKVTKAQAEDPDNTNDPNADGDNLPS